MQQEPDAAIIGPAAFQQPWYGVCQAKRRPAHYRTAYDEDTEMPCPCFHVHLVLKMLSSAIRSVRHSKIVSRPGDASSILKPQSPDNIANPGFLHAEIRNVILEVRRLCPVEGVSRSPQCPAKVHTNRLPGRAVMSLLIGPSLNGVRGDGGGALGAGMGGRSTTCDMHLISVRDTLIPPARQGCGGGFFA